MANIENKPQATSVPKEVKVISIFCYVIASLNLFQVVLSLSRSFNLMFKSLGISIAYVFYFMILISTGFNSSIPLLDSLYGKLPSKNLTILFVILAIIWFFVGFGMSQRIKWSRTVAILGFAMGTFATFYFGFSLREFENMLVSSLIILIINSVPCIYLIFNNKIKSFFS